MTSNRRDFLVGLLGLGAGLSSPARLFGSGRSSVVPDRTGPDTGVTAGGSTTVQELLPTRTIPASGEEIPVIGFGSSKSVLEIPEAGTEPIAAVLRTFMARGGRVVDSSIRPEEIDREFGELLQRPEFSDLFVTAKVNTSDEQTGIDQFRQTQRLFGRRTLDLVQIESLRGLEAHWPNLQEWRESGEARYIGVTVSSNFNHDRLEAFMRTESPDFVHVNYSVVERNAEERLLPLAQERGMAVLLNRPFMNGSWFGIVEGRILPEWAADFDCETWAQFSIKYALAHPAVTCVLTETTDTEHMEDNVGGGLGRLPDEATRRRMRDLVETF